MFEAEGGFIVHYLHRFIFRAAIFEVDFIVC